MFYSALMSQSETKILITPLSRDESFNELPPLSRMLYMVALVASDDAGRWDVQSPRVIAHMACMDVDAATVALRDLCSSAGACGLVPLEDGGYSVRGWETFRERRSRAQIRAADQQRARRHAAKAGES
jgi:hypothetical protein